MIVLPVELTGPKRRVTVPMILDTGSMASGVNENLLAQLGYDPQAPDEQTYIGTASEVRPAGIFIVQRMKTMGTTLQSVPIIALHLPPEIAAGGLLGLDFFSDRRFTIDMHEGWIEID